MSSNPKNIKRNSTRPSKSRTPYLMGKSSSGSQSEYEVLKLMDKKLNWDNLGNDISIKITNTNQRNK